MSGFVAQIHHDFAIGLQIIVLSFNLRKVRAGQIERNSYHGFSGRASPFVCQITYGPELQNFFLLQFTIELLHESRD